MNERARRVVASVLAVLGGVLLLLSSFGWWAERYFLDSARFASKANQILDQEAVQQALAVAVTDQISRASGRDLRIAEPLVATIVREVVRSDAFRAVFDGAVSRVHRAVVGGEARDAVLNLSRTVDQVKAALDPVAPELAAEIPDGEKVQVKLLDESGLQTIYDTTNLVQQVVVAITVLTLACLAGAVACSPRRWQTLALAGWVTLGVFAFSLVAVWVGRIVTGSLIADADYSSAAEAAYKVITRGLVVQGLLFGILGLLTGLGAGWIDQSGGWAVAREVLGHATAWVRAQVPERAPLHGALAPRLPQPSRHVRSVHLRRAAALAALGAYAVSSPRSLTAIVVVLLGMAALYLALTEAVAAWAAPREARAAGEPPR